MVKQKVVIKLSMEDQKKNRNKALKIAVGMGGILSASIDGDNIVVEGDGFDSVALITVLRKKLHLHHVELVSVTPSEKKKDDKPKEKDEETKEKILQYYPVPPPYMYPWYAFDEVSHYPSCNIL